MERVLANLTSKQLKKLDRLVKLNDYGSRSEAIRDALILLLKSEKFPELRKIIKNLRKTSPKKEMENKIIKTLKNHPAGLSLLKIAEISQLHRHTIRKYVRKLVSQGFMREKKIGTAKICVLTKKGTDYEK